MITMTKEEIEQFRILEDKLYLRVVDIVKKHPSLKEKQKDVSEVHLQWDKVKVHWEAHWSYGGQDEGEYDFPLECLWSDDWLDKLIADDKDKKEKEAKRKAAEEEIVRQATERVEREMLGKLKAKYESS